MLGSMLKLNYTLYDSVCVNYQSARKLLRPIGTYLSNIILRINCATVTLKDYLLVTKFFFFQYKTHARYHYPKSMTIKDNNETRNKEDGPPFPTNRR